MSFIVQCPYCRVKARVPDRAMGASGKCTRCSSSFSLVPADDQKQPELVGAVAAGEPSSSDLEPVAASSVSAAIAEADAEMEDHADIADAPSSADAYPTNSASSQSRRVAVMGAAALLCVGIALVCASVPFLCRLVVPLGGLGLLVAVVAVVFARGSTKRRLILPISAAAACFVLLIVGLFFPAALGPTYLRSRQTSEPAVDPSALRLIPLGSAPHTAAIPEWTDATQYALQRGDVRVQVVGVSLGPTPTKEEKAAKEKLLLVRVRVTLTHRTESKLFDWTENRVANPWGNPGPTLADDVGKSFPFRASKVIEEVGGKRRGDLFPIRTADEVLAFEKPADVWQSLRLEVPGAAWGGVGVFRFTLPASMIGTGKPG